MDQEPNLRLSEKCLKLSFKEVHRSTRKFLSSWLDTPTDGVNRDYVNQDWSGLAELMNFGPQEIQNFAVKEKTMSLLQAYSLRPDSTVARLWKHLIELERYDLIEDERLKGMLERDAKMFYERELLQEQDDIQRREEAHRSRPVQVPKVSSFAEPDFEQIDRETDQYANMVVDDVEKNQKTYFDAFVSYCHDDLPFVQEMIRMLETVHGLRLCVNARDLLAGGSTHFLTAKLIADRCRKVILVMSPSFLRSPECEFQVKIALSLSPGAKRKILIPILFKYSRMPLVLQHVCLVDYTKSDLAEWFWGRLAASLKESRSHHRLISKYEIDSLSYVQMDLTLDNKRSDRPDITTQKLGREEGYAGCGNDDDLYASNNYRPSYGSRVNHMPTMRMPPSTSSNRTANEATNTYNFGRNPMNSRAGLGPAWEEAQGDIHSTSNSAYKEENFNMLDTGATADYDLLSLHTIDFDIQGLSDSTVDFGNNHASIQDPCIGNYDDIVLPDYANLGNDDDDDEDNRQKNRSIHSLFPKM